MAASTSEEARPRVSTEEEEEEGVEEEEAAAAAATKRDGVDDDDAISLVGNPAADRIQVLFLVLSGAETTSCLALEIAAGAGEAQRRWWEAEAKAETEGIRRTNAEDEELLLLLLLQLKRGDALPAAASGEEQRIGEERLLSFLEKRRGEDEQNARKERNVSSIESRE